jgi:hypothetical protein
VVYRYREVLEETCANMNEVEDDQLGMVFSLILSGWKVPQRSTMTIVSTYLFTHVITAVASRHLVAQAFLSPYYNLSKRGVQASHGTMKYSVSDPRLQSPPCHQKNRTMRVSGIANWR